MEAKTISDIFDTKLRAFSGGIVMDEYEKSLYLTDAQNAYYNALLEPFEDNSLISMKLARLVTELTILTSSSTSSSGGLIIDLGVEVRDILKDSVEITHTSPMHDNKVLSVVEDRLAEIQESLNNPFRKPNLFFENAIRVINEFGTYSKVQIFIPAGATLKKYNATVAKKATPIVLEALPDGLNVQGQTVVTTAFSFADSEMQEIINLAVNTAIEDSRMFAAGTKQAAT